MNALPTFVNLQRKCVNICDICPAFGMEPESNLHVFVKCEVAKRVWGCWLDSPVDLLNVNMDIIDIAMKFLNPVHPVTRKFSLGLHGQYGIIEIKLCMSFLVRFLIIFGVLLEILFLNSKGP